MARKKNSDINEEDIEVKPAKRRGRPPQSAAAKAARERLVARAKANRKKNGVRELPVQSELFDEDNIKKTNRRRKYEIAGVAFIAFGIISLLGVIGINIGYLNGLTKVMQYLFGWGSAIPSAYIVAFGLCMLVKHHFLNFNRMTVGCSLMLLSLLMLWHGINSAPNTEILPDTLIAGGGLVGGAAVLMARKLVGVSGAYIVAGAIFVISILLLTTKSLGRGIENTQRRAGQGATAAKSAATAAAGYMTEKSKAVGSRVYDNVHGRVEEYREERARRAADRAEMDRSEYAGTGNLTASTLQKPAFDQAKVSEYDDIMGNIPGGKQVNYETGEVIDRRSGTSKTPAELQGSNQENTDAKTNEGQASAIKDVPSFMTREDNQSNGGRFMGKLPIFGLGTRPAQENSALYDREVQGSVAQDNAGGYSGPGIHDDISGTKENKAHINTNNVNKTADTPATRVNYVSGNSANSMDTTASTEQAAKRKPGRAKRYIGGAAVGTNVWGLKNEPKTYAQNTYKPIKVANVRNTSEEIELAAAASRQAELENSPEAIETMVAPTRRKNNPGFSYVETTSASGKSTKAKTIAEAMGLAGHAAKTEAAEAGNIVNSAVEAASSAKAALNNSGSSEVLDNAAVDIAGSAAAPVAVSGAASAANAVSILAGSLAAKGTSIDDIVANRDIPMMPAKDGADASVSAAGNDLESVVENPIQEETEALEAETNPDNLNFTVEYSSNNQGSATELGTPKDDDPSAEEQAEAATANSTHVDRLRNVNSVFSAASDKKTAATKNSESKPIPPYELPNVKYILSKSVRQFDDRLEAEISENAKVLQQTLNDFKVRADILNACHGPAVTRYEVKPAPGVKVSKVTSLSDDIALNMAATAVRIEQIPGKAAIGIEIPNQTLESVQLREVLENPRFASAKSKLTVGLGKDISGQAIFADLAKMPHLLVAGATGSGKSVCINTMITSILFKARPEEVKFILIDPKMVELSVYNDIPHLMVPVVTDARKAAAVLNWAVQEMEKRYSRIAEVGVRNAEGYNRFYRDDPSKQMSSIVIIIDELADLMMVASHEVEDSICRLAQKARAAGIYMVLATQRPSVNVITGVIKANIPSRISFAVTSQIDSRTILDTAGAEKLLGRGDMLFMPQGTNKPTRIQGAFVSDHEVEELVEFIKKQGHKPEANQEIIDFTNKALAEDNEESGPVTTKLVKADPLLREAVELVMSSQNASVSSVQRRYRIGYTRAGRLIDTMEDLGIVGPNVGSKPREILVTPEQAFEIMDGLEM